MAHTTAAALRSLGSQVLVFVMASAVQYGLGSEPRQGWLAPGRDRAGLIFIAFLVLLAIVNACLFFVHVSLNKEPWSYEWSLWQLILEIVAGLWSALCAVLARVFLPDFSPLAHLMHSHQPLSTHFLLILLVVLIIGIPASRYWATAQRFKDVRIAKVLLTRLSKRYNEQLSNPALDPARHFPLDMSVIPEAIAPFESAPMPASTATSPVPGKRFAMTQESTYERLWRLLEDAQGQLLILAEPGGGKSTQLYLLARNAIAEAQRALQDILQGVVDGTFHQGNFALPRLPLIIDVSIFDSRFGAPIAGSLESLIVESLVKVYAVPKGTAKRWVRLGRFLPLLDALDIMNSHHRRDWVEKINAYLGEHSSEPLVVCCRGVEYYEIPGARLMLRQAVMLELLTPGAVDEVLMRAGVSEVLRQGARADPALRETLRTPMMLSLALLSFSNHEADAVVLTNTDQVAQWREALCRGYVRNALQSCSSHQKHWIGKVLAWLGYQLRAHDKLVFHLEDMERDWLPSRTAERRYQHLLVGVSISIMAFCLLFGVIIAQVILLVYALGNGKAVTLIFGPGAGANIGTASRLVGVIGGLGIGLSIGGSVDAAKHIALFRYVKPARREHRQALAIATMLGVLAALVARLVGGYSIGLIGAFIIGVGVALTIGLVIGLSGGLLSERRYFPWPNSGLRNSMRFAVGILLCFLLAGLFVGGIFAAGVLWQLLVLNAAGRSFSPQHILSALLVGMLVIALSADVFVGLGVALDHGGAAVLQHLMLRRVLVHAAVIPRRLVLVLESARTMRLLYREGGGYTFLVRSALLRDYFAAAYERTYATESIPSPRVTPLRTRFRKWYGRVHLSRRARPRT